jgi:hypothetical protein
VPETLQILETLAASGLLLLAVKYLGTPTRRAISKLKTLVVADHASINMGGFSSDRGGRKRAFVNICCGPSYRRRAGSLDRNRAEQWVMEHWPEVRPEPTYASPELLRFQGASPREEVGETPVLQIWAHGLIEVSLPLAHIGDDVARPSLSLEDVLGRLLRFTTGIRMGGHEFIFGKPRLRRRQLDWRISVSSALTTDTGWTPIRHFTLNGVHLTGKPPEMSIDGSMSLDAELSLRSKSSRLEPSVVVTAFFNSALAQSGYPPDVVDRTVAQLLSLKEEERFTLRGREMAQ